MPHHFGYWILWDAHYVDVDGHLLYTRGEHELGYTSNHSEFLGLLRALEVLVECNWHHRGDYTLVHGDSYYVLKTMTGEWRPSAPHLANLFEQVRAFTCKHRLKV